MNMGLDSTNMDLQSCQGNNECITACHCTLCSDAIVT
jgi:hypothetical protein